MKEILDLSKRVFNLEKNYTIKNHEVLDINSTKVDHLLDYRSKGLEINPIMHIFVNVELNGERGRDLFIMNSIAEFQNDGKVNYGLWNSKETKSRYNNIVDCIDLQKPGMNYILLSHDWLKHLKNHEWQLKEYFNIELERQQEGFVPKRGLDQNLIDCCIENYHFLRGVIKSE